MNHQESIALITAFRDFCLSKGSAVIDHHSLLGWDGCAVGQFAATRNDIPNGLYGRGFEMADRLFHAYAVILPGIETIQDLGQPDTAEMRFPGFADLAQALTHDLESIDSTASQAA